MPKATIKKVKVILTGRVRNLGKRGDVVSVKPGYFRNFLSKELAITYSDQKLEQIKSTLQSTFNEKYEAQAQENAKILDGKFLFFARQASGTNILFASVSKRDIIQEIKTLFGIDINIKQLYLSDIIKLIGVYNFSVDLSENVSVSMKIAVGQTIDAAKALIEDEGIISGEAVAQI